MQEEEEERFDPARYLSRVKGAEYLEVKWRLLWLRREHPDAQLLSELVRHGPEMAVFKATVTLPSGGTATGYGSETASDFPDFIEKAETKAIGRALAVLGFGTQFCADHERGEAGAEERAPIGQLRYLEQVAQKAGLSDEALDGQSHALFGVPVHALRSQDAARLAQVIRGSADRQQWATGSPARVAAVPDVCGSERR